MRDFPDISAGKESTCNAGDSSLIPGLGRSTGEGKGYPFQYSGLENPRYSPWGREELDTMSHFHFHFNYEALAFFSCFQIFVFLFPLPLFNSV